MIVEVTQSGVFALTGFATEQRQQVLATMCPNILFPYVREQVDSLMTRGGFPPIHLAPVNFDSVYAQAVQAQADKDTNPSH
jgi:preprotein translocase subunit SecB